MSVSTTHKDYDANKWKWQRCRDVIAGKDAIIQNGRSRERYVGSLFDYTFNPDLYLPRLTNQTDAEYIAYADRAAFFNATGRTLDAMTGLVFAKDPQFQLDTAIDAYQYDITLSDTNLREFSEQVVEQQIAVGRVGIMVDYPENVPQGISIADAERLNVRPFLRWYATENIINWREEMVGGAKRLTMVVLKETKSIQTSEFVVEDRDQYRVLQLTDEGYRVRIYNDDNTISYEVFPTQRGARMNYIPFTILGANSASAEVQKPPLLDLVDTNLAHYRNSADYEHGLHLTGLPTPYVAGVQLAEGQILALGSKTAWVFPDPSAKAEFLEFKGDGLKTLREALKDKEHRMAVLGARMLADDKRTAEAFGTIELKTAGERSVLASISRSASDAMTRCLDWMSAWVGAPEDNEFALNTDYGATRMEPQMLTALIGAYQSDTMPLSVLFDNLQQGELIRPDMAFEEYEAQLGDQGPDLAVPAAPAQEPDQNTFIASIRERLGV